MHTSGWRSIFIAKSAKLSSHLSQLVIEQEEKISIPIEDIGAVMIETREISITSNLLSMLSEANVAVFFCNDKHLPCSVLLPFQPHSRQWKVMKAQMAMSKPFMKQCWRLIIEQKIFNQARCLDLMGKAGGGELLAIRNELKTGDSTNREAVAAKAYFRYLFENFRRKDENVTTGAMNYGYAIIRGAIARTLSTYGFIPAMGIFHTNELNNFNLADDFLEVYRPVVDLWVAQNISPRAIDLSQNNRVGLVGLLHEDMLMKTGKLSIVRCIEEMVASFSSSCQENDVKLLKMPELIPFQQLQYE